MTCDLWPVTYGRGPQWRVAWDKGFNEAAGAHLLPQQVQPTRDDPQPAGPPPNQPTHHLSNPPTRGSQVEQNLWKAVFYKPIEEFRSRVRALEGLAKGAAGGGGAAGAGGAGGGAGAAGGHGASTSPGGGGGGMAPVQLATPEEARAQLGRTTGAYLRFLDEALAFYRKTVRGGGWQWRLWGDGRARDGGVAVQGERNG